MVDSKMTSGRRFWLGLVSSTVDRLMPKKTKKRKLRARRSKANHGKRPNAGRG